ncbi:MAG: JAB domain-containing protein [Cobetia sp.]|jgi:DNA repair protein RadC|uniref:DNA repair protein RadC n=1 Tax=Cobetia amphilecti TaxID=1055104 RepID=A0AAP4TXA8_9GAMM|nr:MULTISPECIES: DNA repair protein RadC [Cobetia]AVV34410.1 JAB domain-containing protein [Halomonas sp. SF2003]MBR9755471.1 JAB domain-containing protein [Gammaproteobacteria bacterium]NVN57246.1 JAB domain-containing protein [bacterium Scap17]TCJ27280.1 JAB domain-containing protein [Halomonas sp. GDM18]UTV85857.1 DNA repair protein RadC [Cobetia litoralis]|tara:strand:+ start:34855 stop:35529 length:675 start_codon:yes stop_codon:yes gene_type:complete
MGIREWPVGERPREKLLSSGAGALSDAELLAIFLRVGIKGRSAVDLARDLLNTFGGLRPLLEATQQDFCAARGLGDAKYVQLQASLELSRRHLESLLMRGAALTSPLLVRRYLSSHLRDLPHEVFAALFLDSQHRVIRFETLFTGTLDAAAVYPREVVKRALALNAGALILAHNHPSGVAEPSEADRRITQRLEEALGLFDIRVLDHFVVGDGEVVSFAERGWL